MAFIAERKIQVLEKPEIRTPDPKSGKKWGIAVCQVWTGKTAGNISVFAAKGSEGDLSDIEAMEKGEYIVDIEERAGDRGNISLEYANPRPVAKSMASQSKPQQQ